MSRCPCWYWSSRTTARLFGRSCATRKALHSRGKITRDVAKAVAFYQLASAQGLDAAQCELGNTLIRGRVVARNYAEGLRLCHLSAAQGYTRAFNSIAECHESGWGVAADAFEAIRWYRRAEAAGDYDAAD